MEDDDEEDFVHEPPPIVRAELDRVPDLTKWPRLIVEGSPVTPDQAAEIAIRTDNWFISTNDREWQDEIHEITGIEKGSNGFPNFNSMQEFRESVKALYLSYLTNDLICSSWIGGPYGWIDWAGNVGCATHNIGKWPTPLEVYDDWRRIATAFPFLDLTCQLITEEGEGKPVVEYRVNQGMVMVKARPETLLSEPFDPPFVALLPGAERGCTPTMLRNAIELAKERVK